MKTALSDSIDFLKPLSAAAPAIGLIMGTGLHRLADAITIRHVVDYADIPHFPVSTVESHTGRLLFGTVEGREVIAMQGRFHGYEGYAEDQIAFPVSVLHGLGVKTLLISNAAGSLNPDFQKGQLMLLRGLISLQDKVFTSDDGSEIEHLFDDSLGVRLQSLARQEQIPLHEGVYVAVQGPMLETRAEYRYLIRSGCDAVGMSTAPEARRAKALKMSCLAVSVLTDTCDPDNLEPVTLQEIIAVAGKADRTLSDLFTKLIATC
ncbi:MAG: purine-nucleoside phosphorylase [Bacteroidota bacterium]